MLETINLEDKFSLFDEYWQPKIIGELNGQFIKIAKFKGEFDWHCHDNEDEYFHIIKGQIIIHLRDKSVHLSTGQCFIVPKGVEHKPEAKEEAHVLMFEPMTTAHTGSSSTELTVEIEHQQRI